VFGRSIAGLDLPSHTGIPLPDTPIDTMSVEYSNKTYHGKHIPHVQQSDKRVKSAVKPQTVEHDEEFAGQAQGKGGLLGAPIPVIRKSLPPAKQAAMNADRKIRAKDPHRLRASSTNGSNEPQQLSRNLSLKLPASAKKETLRTAPKDRLSSGVTSEEMVPKKTTEASFPHNTVLSEPNDKAVSQQIGTSW